MNYEKKVMESAYNILMKDGFEWGPEFNTEMQSQFLNLLLEYFTDIEHYEKCADIVKMQTLETNANIGKDDITKGDKC
jgi:hypothetical protein